MTFLEKFMHDFPDRKVTPHPEGCPESYEYEPPRDWSACQADNCCRCWRREAGEACG